ncbi:MAG: hypothetical protein CG440_118, partial [Methanosaeta sp. NSM2]
ILTALAQDHRALLAGFAFMLLAVVAYLRLLDGAA